MALAPPLGLTVVLSVMTLVASGALLIWIALQSNGD